MEDIVNGKGAVATAISLHEEEARTRWWWWNRRDWTRGPCDLQLTEGELVQGVKAVGDDGRRGYRCTAPERFDRLLADLTNESGGGQGS